VLSDEAEIMYKCTDLYDPSDEGGVLWSDPTLAIAWPLAGPPTLSAKDAALPLLASARLPAR
jgi:dTDP-4-dehydrorhamnose 3,5-epimerase